MTGVGVKRFGSPAVLCVGAILALGVAPGHPPSSQAQAGIVKIKQTGIVKIKLPHVGDFALVEVSFKTKAKSPTLRLLNQGELAKSILIFGGVAKLKGKPGTFVALVAVVNRKTSRTTAGTAQDEPPADLDVGGAVQSTTVEQNILEGGAGGEPFPGPPSESDLFSRMSPGIYTKANWPTELVKRPITLAKSLFEIARDVRAGRQPDSALIRRAIDAGYGPNANKIMSPSGSGNLTVDKVVCYANGTGGNPERDADLSLNGSSWHFQQVFPASYFVGGPQDKPSFFIEDGPPPYNGPMTHIFGGFGAGLQISGDLRMVTPGQKVTVHSDIIDYKTNKVVGHVDLEITCP